MPRFDKKIVQVFWSGLILMALCGFSPVNDIETAIIEKDYKKAEEMALDFIKTQPKSPDSSQVKYYLGVSQLGLSQYPQARQTFRQLLKLALSDQLKDKAWLGVIDSLILEEKFDESLAESERFLKDRHQSEFLSVIYLKLGRANLKLTRWDKAQQYFNRLIRDFPNSFEAYLAQQLLEEKRYFTIQVGAFKDRARALNLVEELKKKGEYAYLVETKDHEGNLLFRVRVGELTSLEEAHRMKQHLSTEGYPTHIFP